jgi:hypothetical protein
VPDVGETAAYYTDYAASTAFFTEGPGRHDAGSNFLWYLKDPAGNFCEYYSDMDCIVDDQLWTPEDLEGARGPVRLGPAAAPFLHPEDRGHDDRSPFSPLAS